MSRDRVSRRHFLNGVAAAPILAAFAASLSGLVACGQTPAPAATPTATVSAATSPTVTPIPYPASVRIGLSLPFTGANSDDAFNMRDSAQLAISELNAAATSGTTTGSVGMPRLDLYVKDEGTVSAGGADSTQASANFQAFLGDPAVVAVVGAYLSSSARAMLTMMTQLADAGRIVPAILVAPGATEPSLTVDPTLRPGGQPYFCRTCGTDASQAAAMADYAFDKLGVRTVVAASDTSENGTYLAKSFAARAAGDGITVRSIADGQLVLPLDPIHLDYADLVRQVAALNPDGLYYDGNVDVGLRFFNPRTMDSQTASFLARVKKMAGDGLYDPAFPQRGGASVAGTYVSIAAPNPSVTPEGRAWLDRFTQASKTQLANFSYVLTTYSAVRVIGDAIQRIVSAGKSLTRANVRSFVLATSLATPQGTISFDQNGDLRKPTVSIVQVGGSPPSFQLADPPS